MMANGRNHRTPACQQQKRHRPPQGKTFLTIGQDLFSIRNYLDVQYNASLHEWMEDEKKEKPPPSRASVLPSTFMFYTDIQTLRGLDTPVDYGSGIEYAYGLLDLFDENENDSTLRLQLQIGLWLNGTQGCQDIIDGVLDAQLERLWSYLIATTSRSRTTTYLRVGYEFDNPSFGYDSDTVLYRQAFRYIVDTYHQSQRHGQEKTVVFVWHSWGAGLRYDIPLADFYPGDDYVDWCGVSLFSQLYTQQGKQTLGNRSTVQDVLDMCISHDKPIMIAESTPFGGIPSLDDPWNDWFQPVLDLIEQNNGNIAMWSYIDCDWDAQPMWHNVGFGDTRLATNRTVLELWRHHVMENPLFLQALDNLEVEGAEDPCDATTKAAGVNPVAMLPAAMIAGAARPHQRQRFHSQQSSSSPSPFILVFAATATALGTCVWIVMVVLRKAWHDRQRTRLLRLLVRQRSEYYGTNHNFYHSNYNTVNKEDSNSSSRSGAWRSSSMDALQELMEP